MDKAAANGHFNVVRWLHEHRTEGCTKVAMDRASLNGQLEIAQWLHTNRKERCTTNEMGWAAESVLCSGCMKIGQRFARLKLWVEPHAVATSIRWSGFMCTEQKVVLVLGKKPPGKVAQWLKENTIQ